MSKVQPFFPWIGGKRRLADRILINYTVNNRSGASSSARELIIRNW